MCTSRGLLTRGLLLVMLAALVALLPSPAWAALPGLHTPTPGSAQRSTPQVSTLAGQVPDLDQDGLADALTGDSSAAPFSAALASDVTIAMVATGAYSSPRSRLQALGFSVTLIQPTSGISVFQAYDVIYLPTNWAQAGFGAYETIEQHADDYRAYVYGGGGLLVEQPNPYGQPDDYAAPSLLPFPIGFYSYYDLDDYPPMVVNAQHYLTAGIAAEDLPFPFDQMTSVDPFYQTLVVGGLTGAPALVVGEYGDGRILVHTANPSPYASNPLSDVAYSKMMRWVSFTTDGPLPTPKPSRTPTSTFTPVLTATPTATPSPTATPRPEIRLTLANLPRSDVGLDLEDTITYTIAYANSGVDVAAQVLITCSVPSGTFYMPGSVGGGGSYDEQTHEIVWALGDLNGGASGQVAFAVGLDAAGSAPPSGSPASPAPQRIVNQGARATWGVPPNVRISFSNAVTNRVGSAYNYVVLPLMLLKRR